MQRLRFASFVVSGAVLLLSHVLGAQAPVSKTSGQAAKSSVTSNGTAAAAATTRPATPGKVGTATLDLNTATPEQLKTLPGIGDAYARRIVAGRPYTMKTQLVSKGVIPQSTYDGIKDSVVAKRTTP